MLRLLDESLEDFLRHAVPLDKSQIDIAFDTPDSEWGSGITRPTINLFLWDIRRSVEENESGREQVVADGVTHWRQRPPRVAFRYLCTAWTTEMEDQHRLLGSILMALLGHSQIPHEYLRGHLADVAPLPTVRIARPDGKDFAEFWPAVEGKLRAGLDVIVTATVDPNVVVPAGPPTTSLDTRLEDVRQTSRTSQRTAVAGHVEDSGAAGVRVLSPRGATRVGADGTFLIPAEPGDEVRVATTPPVSGVVASDGTLELSGARE